MEVIDLVGQTEFVEEEPNTEHWIRIGNFQCAICMDHCCGLVATHCGTSPSDLVSSSSHGTHSLFSAVFVLFGLLLIKQAPFAGHLFCTTCLDSALKADAIRNNCPICRATIESKQRSLYTNRTKGYWPLELKILVAPRKAESTSSDAAISL